MKATTLSSQQFLSRRQLFILANSENLPESLVCVYTLTTCLSPSDLSSPSSSVIFSLKSLANSLLTIRSFCNQFSACRRSAVMLAMNRNTFLLSDRVSVSSSSQKQVLPQSAKLASILSSSAQALPFPVSGIPSLVTLRLSCSSLRPMQVKSSSVFLLNSCSREVLSRFISFWYCYSEMSSILANLPLSSAQLASCCCRQVISSESTWFCPPSYLFCNSCSDTTCRSSDVYRPSSVLRVLSFSNSSRPRTTSHSSESCLSIRAFMVSACIFTFSASLALRSLYCSTFFPILAMACSYLANCPSFSAAISCTVKLSALSSWRWAYRSLSRSSSSRRRAC